MVRECQVRELSVLREREVNFIVLCCMPTFSHQSRATNYCYISSYTLQHLFTKIVADFQAAYVYFYEPHLSWTSRSRQLRTAIRILKFEGNIVSYNQFYAARDAKQVAYHRRSCQRSRESWDEYVHARSLAEKTYRDAEKEYVSSVRKKLSNSSDPHKWWSTLKSAVFGLCSSLPPLLSDGGELVTNPKGKADLLMTHFVSKLSRKQLQLDEDVDVKPTLINIAFRSSEVEKLLNALDPHGGTDPIGMFPLFLKETSRVLAPKLSAVFRRLLRSGSFPVCWRVANITSIPKGSPSPNVSNYRPISITPILSKVFEHLISTRLSRFLERSCLLSSNQFAYRKNLGTTDVLLTISHKIQSARIVQLDLSAAFDWVNHDGLLWKLRSVGVGVVGLD